MTHILVYVFSGSYALGLNLNAKHCTLKVDLLDRLRERSVFKWANVQRLFYRAFTTGNYLSTVSLCIDFFFIFFLPCCGSSIAPSTPATVSQTSEPCYTHYINSLYRETFEAGALLSALLSLLHKHTI